VLVSFIVTVIGFGKFKRFEKRMLISSLTATCVYFVYLLLQNIHFSALILLMWWWEENPACNNATPAINKGFFSLGDLD